MKLLPMNDWQARPGSATTARLKGRRPGMAEVLIRITVKGGCVVDVTTEPEIDFEYEVNDLDFCDDDDLPSI